LEQATNLSKKRKKTKGNEVKLANISTGKETIFQFSNNFPKTGKGSLFL